MRPVIDTQLLTRRRKQMKIHSVPVWRTLAWYLASIVVGTLFLFPFRGELSATVPAVLYPPAWFLPIHIIIGIGLWVLFFLIWKNRPDGVFGQ